MTDNPSIDVTLIGSLVGGIYALWYAYKSLMAMHEKHECQRREFDMAMREIELSREQERRELLSELNGRQSVSTPMKGSSCTRCGAPKHDCGAHCDYCGC